MGFCLFNNIAIAARSLQEDHGIRQLLIVDWDVHHGNGTQDIFYDDGDVYYLSLHQSPWYPGTGAEAERGQAGGEGRTRNVPIPADTPGTAYLAAFTTALDAALAEFSPEFVLVSAGFDCLRGDPLGQLTLEPRDLHAMTRRLMQIASGRVAMVLEGGYAPRRVGDGVVDVFRALCGLDAKAHSI